MKLHCCLALGLLAALVSCTTPAPPVPTPPPRGPAAPRPVRQDLGYTEFFRRTHGWVAGDGAFSVPLADGRLLWLFGDSHLDDYDPATGTMPCLFQARNAALLQDPRDPENVRTLDGNGPGFRSWFKNSTNETETWFWPGCGLQQANTVFVYLAALHKTPAGGQWGFENAEHDYWAKINFPALDSITYVALPPFHGISFGCGFVRDGQYTYAFGGKRTGLASDLYVARFEATVPEGPWSFWNGSAWSDNVTNAVAVGRGASTSLHVCKIGSQFLLTTSAFSVACDQGKDIFICTATRPTGPFSPKKKVYTIPDTFQGHYPFFYLPVAHPELLNSQNELLITYSINGYEPCIRACVDGRAIPDHYRPKAFRVPLELLDSTTAN